MSDGFDVLAYQIPVDPVGVDGSNGASQIYHISEYHKKEAGNTKSI